MCFLDPWDSPPTVFHVTRPKARKDHRCCECQKAIPRGTHYSRIWGVWDGDARGFKVCDRCERIRELIQKEDGEAVVPFGGLLCCLRERNRERRRSITVASP